jgi:hypothetical protein
MEVGRLGHRLKGTIVYLGAERADVAVQSVQRFEYGAGEECQILQAALRTYHATTRRAPRWVAVKRANVNRAPHQPSAHRPDCRIRSATFSSARPL